MNVQDLKELRNHMDADSQTMNGLYARIQKLEQGEQEQVQPMRKAAFGFYRVGIAAMLMIMVTAGIGALVIQRFKGGSEVEDGTAATQVEETTQQVTLDQLVKSGLYISEYEDQENQYIKIIGDQISYGTLKSGMKNFQYYNIEEPKIYAYDEEFKTITIIDSETLEMAGMIYTYLEEDSYIYDIEKFMESETEEVVNMTAPFIIDATWISKKLVVNYMPEDLSPDYYEEPLKYQSTLSENRAISVMINELTEDASTKSLEEIAMEEAESNSVLVIQTFEVYQGQEGVPAVFVEFTECADGSGVPKYNKRIIMCLDGYLITVYARTEITRAEMEEVVEGLVITE